MSAHDILKEHGTWIESYKFIEIFAKKTNVSNRQAYRKIKKSLKNKEIQKYALQDRRVLYGLRDWPFNEKEEIVVCAIEKWRRIAFRDPLPEEIANETSMPSQEAEEFARKTRGETGWESPNQAIQDFSTEKLGEVLTCLGRLRIGKASKFDYEDDPETMKEAELSLKEHLEILPKLDEEGNFISWPPKALKYLKKNYKPKDRRKFDPATFRLGPEHNPWRPFNR
jgi:hypothetical protein